jgi:hypothetical protein
MAHLTLQEVIERIDKIRPPGEGQRSQSSRMEDLSHRPEFYVPRIVRRLANLRLSDITLSGITKRPERV